MELNKIYTCPTSASFAIANPHWLRFIRKRVKAKSEDIKGPITLIVVPKDVGKTTLCRFLLNYAVRSVRCPLFIDLDVGQNLISVPGTIGIANIQKPGNIYDNFEEETSKVFHFGYTSPGNNIPLFGLLFKKVRSNSSIRGLRGANPKTRYSGVIINTCGCSGYDIITFAAIAFKIDVLCVLQEERLYQQLLKDMSLSVKVVFTPKMNGAVERIQTVRSESRDAHLKKFFYGPSNELQPFTFGVKYSEFKVLKILSRVGVKVVTNVTLNVILLPIHLDHRLIDQVLTLSSAEVYENDLILAHAFGFICITGINVDENIITVLSPQPGPLPKKVLLVGVTELIQRQ
ncbi:UNVERIFIED_CONTAM: cbc [Trichonephila clavipes]